MGSGNRRSVPFAALALVVALSGCAWVQARADAGNSGFNAGERVIGAGNVAQLAPTWSDPAGERWPVVEHEGRVFASDHGAVTAYDLDDGTVLWSKPPVDPDPNTQRLGTGLALWTDGPDDVVYVSESTRVFLTGKVGGALSAYAAADGHLLWRSTLGRFAQVTVDGDRVYAAVNRVVGNESDFSGVLAFDAATGAERARFPTNSRFAIAGGTLYTVGSADLRAYPTACSAMCAPAWTAPLSSVADAALVVAGGRVFVGTPSGLQVFAASGCGASACVAQWGASGASDQMGVANGRLYTTSSWLRSPETPMRVYDVSGCGALAECPPLWSTAAEQFGPPTIANGLVLTASRGGLLEAWPAAGCGSTTCAPLSSRPTSGYGNPTVIVAEGHVIVSAFGLFVYALPPA